MTRLFSSHLIVRYTSWIGWRPRRVGRMSSAGVRLGTVLAIPSGQYRILYIDVYLSSSKLQWFIQTRFVRNIRNFYC